MTQPNGEVQIDADDIVDAGQSTESAAAAAADKAGAAETPVTLAELGARMKAAVNAADPQPAKPGAEAPKAGAEGEGEKAGAAVDGETFTFKAHGQEKTIPVKEAREILASYEGYLAEKAKLEATYQEQVDRITKPYLPLITTIEKHPAVGKAVKALEKHPSLAGVFFSAVSAAVKDGKLHPDTLKAERLELEDEHKSAETSAADKAAAAREGQKLLNEHLGEVATKHGLKVEYGDETFEKLVTLMRETGVKDIRVAAELYLVKSGELEKRLAEKHGKKADLDERIGKAAGVRPGVSTAQGRQAPGRATLADMEQIGARMKRALAGS
jgi:hypothetical protein